ncbi:hypothetical protein F2P81_015365 [Scophthalmus maximus]|uniref:Uncharacterized protein n=1 Tax=Scophthalmus maximus TaxID=52904 RepID=A0A6A4SKL8_SCOMX|nr:hypothetical protein F2P81_015365 [Scophthalmus maximus]
MRAASDVDLSKPRAPMPAAMLPCPAPAGPDWSFQNPVGVDCSSPEPRCIWLAVLRGTTTGPVPPPPSLPPAMPTGQSKGSLLQPRIGSLRVCGVKTEVAADETSYDNATVLDRGRDRDTRPREANRRWLGRTQSDPTVCFG